MKKRGNHRYNQLPPALTKTDNCDDPIVITFDDVDFKSRDMVEVATAMQEMFLFILKVKTQPVFQMKILQ